ncbi:hypothetical protein GH733_000219 [Mirounga leonina]|nr:hypothetical protein GH733_000219 [Mirounga leonina]
MSSRRLSSRQALKAISWPCSPGTAWKAPARPPPEIRERRAHELRHPIRRKAAVQSMKTCAARVGDTPKEFQCPFGRPQSEMAAEYMQDTGDTIIRRWPGCEATMVPTGRPWNRISVARGPSLLQLFPKALTLTRPNLLGPLVTISRLPRTRTAVLYFQKAWAAATSPPKTTPSLARHGGGGVRVRWGRGGRPEQHGEDHRGAAPVQTKRHREERRRQQQLDAQRLDGSVNADHGPSYSTRRSGEPPSRRPGERRKAEMKRLYGDSAAKIQAMEAAVQLSFDKHGDRKQPKYWPVIPLKF